MTTTHPITPPAGTIADTWQPENYRIVCGPRRGIPGRDDFTVTTTAAQLGDGSIDDGSTIEPPHISLDHPDRGLTAAQARALAALLLDAATAIEGWALQAEVILGDVPPF